MSRHNSLSNIFSQKNRSRLGSKSSEKLAPELFTQKVIKVNGKVQDQITKNRLVMQEEDRFYTDYRNNYMDKSTSSNFLLQNFSRYPQYSQQAQLQQQENIMNAHRSSQNIYKSKQYNLKALNRKYSPTQKKLNKIMKSVNLSRAQVDQSVVDMQKQTQIQTMINPKNAIQEESKEQQVDEQNQEEQVELNVDDQNFQQIFALYKCHTKQQKQRLLLENQAYFTHIFGYCSCSAENFRPCVYIRGQYGKNVRPMFTGCYQSSTKNEFKTQIPLKDDNIQLFHEDSFVPVQSVIYKTTHQDDYTPQRMSPRIKKPVILKDPLPCQSLTEKRAQYVDWKNPERCEKISQPGVQMIQGLPSQKTTSYKEQFTQKQLEQAFRRQGKDPSPFAQVLPFLDTRHQTDIESLKQHQNYLMPQNKYVPTMPNKNGYISSSLKDFAGVQPQYNYSNERNIINRQTFQRFDKLIGI